MRFYWFDGKAPQGPLEIADLLAQPGFNAETVVCPVGAERPEDWKPAVNYEPLRDALFKPKPVLLSAPPALLAPCPSCRQPNADDALFCSHCGRALKEPAPPTQEPAPSPVPPVSPALPKPPELSAGPKRGPAPGTMGRLAQQQSPAQVPAAAKPPEARPPAAAPSRPAPAPAAAGKGKRTLLLAAGAFCAAFLVLAGVFLWRHRTAQKSPAAPPELAPPAAAKLGTQEGSPTPAAAQPAEAPAETPKVAAKAPQAKPPAAPTKLRAPARKPRPAAAAPAPAPLEPPAGPTEPSDAELGKLLKAAPKPDEELLLPGIPKKVRKASEEAGDSAPSGPEEVMKERVKEQFNFCHQLIRQGNFGDFFDTCLCAPSRQAAPYKGRRRVFIEKASEDPAGELGSSAEIVSVLLEGETARVAAKWSGPDGPIERTEKWVVEDGLWCLQR